MRSAKSGSVRAGAPWLAVVVGLATASCTSIDASSFPSDCEVDRDCVGVYSGDVCGSPRCLCENSVISRSVLEEYTALREGIWCPVAGDPRICSCAGNDGFCVEGRCSLERPSLFDE